MSDPRQWPWYVVYNETPLLGLGGIEGRRVTKGTMVEEGRVSGKGTVHGFPAGHSANAGLECVISTHVATLG